MLPETWKDFLGPEGLGVLHPVLARAEKAYETAAVCPPKNEIFTAFQLTKPENVRVVILGQDPYHEPGQAHGLAFSVRKGVAFPPSLRNIFTELESDVGVPRPQSGDLTAWARQGVLLLNTVLTVGQGAANSHKDLGWQEFTDYVVAALAELPQPMAFVLWGAQAQKKTAAVRSQHPRLILSAPHPSPLSSYRGFFGSRPFSQINDFLSKQGEKTIYWRL